MMEHLHIGSLDNDINIYFDTEIPEGNLTIVMYDVGKRRIYLL